MYFSFISLFLCIYYFFLEKDISEAVSQELMVFYLFKLN